jgi:hypothetical protein
MLKCWYGYLCFWQESIEIPCLWLAPAYSVSLTSISTYHVSNRHLHTLYLWQASMYASCLRHTSAITPYFDSHTWKIFVSVLTPCVWQASAGIMSLTGTCLFRVSDRHASWESVSPTNICSLCVSDRHHCISRLHVHDKHLLTLFLWETSAILFTSHRHSDRPLYTSLAVMVIHIFCGPGKIYDSIYYLFTQIRTFECPQGST